MLTDRGLVLIGFMTYTVAFTVAAGTAVAHQGTIAGTVSGDNFEPLLNVAEQLVALNKPDHNGAVTLGCLGCEHGVLSEARARFTSSFPVNSADFIGTRCIGGTGDLVEDCVEAATIVNLTPGYRIPNTGAIAQLAVSNLFDTDYRNLVGVPTIGRLALLQLKYEF